MPFTNSTRGLGYSALTLVLLALPVVLTACGQPPTEAPRSSRADSNQPSPPPADVSIEEARALWETRKPDALRQSLELFEQAAAKDPTSAAAWGGIADASALLGLYSLEPPSATMPKAMAAANRAIDLQPASSTYASLGLAQYLYLWDFDAAERSFLESLRLDPNNSSAHHWFAMMLSVEGRFDAAIEHIRSAVAADPNSRLLTTKLVTVLTSASEFEQAELAAADALAKFPDYPLLHREIGLLRLRQERYPDAVAAFRRALGVETVDVFDSLDEEILREGNPKTLAALGYALALLERSPEAETILTALRQRTDTEATLAMEIAHVLAGLGSDDEAFRYLNLALKERDPGLVYLFTKSGYHRLSPVQLREFASKINSQLLVSP